MGIGELLIWMGWMIWAWLGVTPVLYEKIEGVDKLGAAIVGALVVVPAFMIAIGIRLILI